MKETQRYKLQDEDLKARDVQRTSEQPLGDIYDIYGMASNVHSKHSTMSRDYTLARYNSEVINAKLPKFIREQRKIVRILESFLIIPLDTLQRRYGESAVGIRKHLLQVYDDIEKLLLGELDEMVIISRAGKGNVIEAMLKHGKTKEVQEEYERSLESEGVMNKLKEEKK